MVICHLVVISPKLGNPVSINAVGSSRNIILNESLTVDDGSDVILHGAVGGTRKLSLGGNLTTLNNNVTINADSGDRILTLKSDVSFDQALDKAATPEFSGLTLSEH